MQRRIIKEQETLILKWSKENRQYAIILILEVKIIIYKNKNQKDFIIHIEYLEYLEDNQKK